MNRMKYLLTITLLASCLFIFNQCSVTPTIHFAKTAKKTVAMVDTPKIAKCIKQVREGKDWKTTEYYSLVCNYSSDDPYFCVIDSNWYEIEKVNDSKILWINHLTNELIEFENDGKNVYYGGYRANLEANHFALSYYVFPIPEMIPLIIADIKKEIDTIIREIPCLVYRAEHDYKYFDSNDKSGNIIESTTYYINKDNYNVDSIIKVSAYDDRNKTSISDKEYIYDFPDFDYEKLEMQFDFKHPQYNSFSRHDNESFSSSSLCVSDNTDITSEDVLKFPLQDCKGQFTTIADKEGWILIDFWQFGCKPCYEVFRQLGCQIDSIGQSVLEKNGVTILAIIPFSDNLERINQVEDKFRVPNLLYAGKGMTTKLAIYSYPSYFLISPNKEVVKQGNHFTDKELLEAIKEYNKKNKQK